VQRVVDGNSVVDIDPGVARQSVARRDADRDDGEVAIDRAPADGAYALQHAAALERIHALAEQQLDAVLRVHVAIEAPDLRPEDSLVRQVHRVDDGHLKTELAGGGRKLAADPAGAHHHDVAAPIQEGAQGVAVSQRSQVVDPIEVRTRDRDSPRLGAGAQEQPVEPELPAVAEADRRGGGVNRGDDRLGQVTRSRDRPERRADRRSPRHAARPRPR
jgi:hypothetical protein